MGKSSINIQPVKGGSEEHNLRLKKYDYVRKDLTPKNYSWSEKSIADTRRELEVLVKEKTGRTMQKKATPIREGVFLIEKDHTDKAILSAIKAVSQKFGIKPFQLHIHRDEGHHEALDDGKKGEWKPNLHAHVLFEWIDRDTGKSFKLNRYDMIELQTDLAAELGMERGESSSKDHLNALQWKLEQERLNVSKIEELAQKEKAEYYKILKQKQKLEKEIKKANELSRSQKTKLEVYEKIKSSNPKENMKLIKMEREINLAQKRQGKGKSI